jgi:hypothetical protein
MRRTLIGIVCATGLLLASAASALGASDNASCVGQFSTFFAHGGGDTQLHRSDVAQFFAHNARPAGAIYSTVGRLHGDLDACEAQTAE